jgi:hypothetical protein
VECAEFISTAASSTFTVTLLNLTSDTRTGLQPAATIPNEPAAASLAPLGVG